MAISFNLTQNLSEYAIASFKTNDCAIQNGKIRLAAYSTLILRK
jgi:hypothetical protein